MLNIATKVPELEGVDRHAIPENVLYSPTPIVLKGIYADWPIVKAAKQGDVEAVDYIRSVYSGEPINASYGPPENKGRVYYNDDLSGFNFTGSKVDLNLVLDSLLKHRDDSEPPTMYVGSTDASRWFPKFLDENSAKIPNTKPLTSLWLGNQSRIAAHYDFPTNLACNVVGRRRFTLFPPSQISNLYPGPIEFAPGGQEISMVDFSDPDYEQFPKFRDAINHAQVAELEPGDALILPSMWWHHVEGLSSLNVLVTHWWRDTPAYLGRPNNALSAAILALRSLPIEQRQAWKHVFDHYIFNNELDEHSHIPDKVKDILHLPLDELHARKLRAELLNKLKR
jgi:hypothetical protein